MSSRILSHKGNVAGWLDASLHDFLRVLPPDAASTKYALITRLDSNPNPASLGNKSPELRRIAKKLRLIGSSLVLPTELLLETDSQTQVFFGFDEVWFFPTASIRPKPPSASLVGPARLNQSRFNDVAKWMSENSCSLGLGGGEGLNFAVKSAWPGSIHSRLLDRAT